MSTPQPPSPTKNTPFAYIGMALRRYFTFSGRSSRAEFWWFVLFCFICGVILQNLAYPLGEGIIYTFHPQEYQLLSELINNPSADENLSTDLMSKLSPAFIRTFFFYSFSFFLVSELILLPPLAAVTARRLHDTGRSCTAAVLMSLSQLIQPIIVFAIANILYTQLSALDFNMDAFMEQMNNLTTSDNACKLIAPIIYAVLACALAGVFSCFVGLYILFCALQPSDRSDNIYGPTPQ